MAVTSPPPWVPRWMVTNFADPVAVADAGFGALAFVLEVLRGDADGGVREEDVVVADQVGPFQ